MPGEDSDDVANMAVELVAGAGKRGSGERGRAGTLKGRIGMMNSMARRLELLEAQVTGATLTDEQEEAKARDSERDFWRKITDLGHKLAGMDAPTVERLHGESAASLVARLTVPGPVEAAVVLEAIRGRLTWLEARGEADEPTTHILRWALELEEARAHEAGAEGEDRHE